MPYIKQALRESVLNRTVDFAEANPAEFNFTITTNLNRYIEAHGLSYDTINSLIGVLECAKLELYRRIAVPYEDKKIKENGDVYTV